MGYLATIVGAFPKSGEPLEWPDAYSRVHPFRLLRFTAFAGLYRLANERAGVCSADSAAGRTFLSPAIPLSFFSAIHLSPGHKPRALAAAVLSDTGRIRWSHSCMLKLTVSAR